MIELDDLDGWKTNQRILDAGISGSHAPAWECIPCVAPRQSMGTRKNQMISNNLRNLRMGLGVNYCFC